MKNIIKKLITNKISDRKTGRNIDIYCDDIFLVSYPKSGNTWLRFLLGNIIYENVDFSNMEKFVPDIYIVNNKKLKAIPKPRILKSHEYFHPKYKKVVYIVRDPRSVAVSYYHYQIKFKKIDEKFPFSEFLVNFIAGHYDSFGTWSENIESWLATSEADTDKFILVRYEDLKVSTYEQLKTITKFIGLNIDDEVMKISIKKSSFDNMKSNEILNKTKIQVLRNSNIEMPFVRAGKIDEWKSYFSDSDHRLLVDNFGVTMQKLGYIL